MEQKRIGLSLKQKLDVIDKFERSQALSDAKTISYRELGSWAQAHFGLPKAPSPATLSKILKEKDAIKEEQSSLATQHDLGRKRKRVVNEAQQTLEKALLEWILGRGSEHPEGKVDDAALIQQAMSIAKEANLVFDEKTFNFSRKWLYKFKEHNNISRTRRRGEAAGAATQGRAAAADDDESTQHLHQQLLLGLFTDAEAGAADQAEEGGQGVGTSGFLRGDGDGNDGADGDDELGGSLRRQQHPRRASDGSC